MKNIILHQMNELIRIQSEILLTIHALGSKKALDQKTLTWLNTSDLHIQYNLSPRTQLRLRGAGLLPFYKLEGKIYYKKAEVDLLINQHKGSIKIAV